jgi:hypothetical protein
MKKGYTLCSDREWRKINAAPCFFGGDLNTKEKHKNDYWK